jgi:uncharacterized RDD family membrane protein YckC
MRCKYCGFANGDDDHRCLRCGRRTAGVVIAAPAGYSGANALAVAPEFDPYAPDLHPPDLHARMIDESRRFEPVQADTAAQPALFAAPGQKIIPFNQVHRQATGKLMAEPLRAASVTTASVTTASVTMAIPPTTKAGRSQTPQQRKVSTARGEQGSLDFLPLTQSAPRTLATDVPAQVYCEQPVATPTHRLIASAMDAAMIFIAFGVFAGAAELMGGSFGEGRLFWIALAGSFTLISLFYGLIWAIAARETAGMRWTDLQLITFDGFPVEGRGRAARMAAGWLSFCSGGLGLLWALADEENLTWHDHISKTFPTVREVPQSFVRQRKH